MTDASGEYVGALTMIMDNGGRRATEASLRASEELYRLLFECSPLPKWLTDIETMRFIAVNEATCRLWGYSREELSRMSASDIVVPLQLPSVIQAVASAQPGHALSGTWQHRRKDGVLIDVDIHAQTFEYNGRPARLVVAQDVTSRKCLEAQLMQAQKMEAVGLLAGGIAHDFNNILSVVATYTSLMLEGLGPNDPRHDDLAEVAKASERAMALTRQLLAFSRQQILQPRTLDLNETVAGIQKMLERMLGESVELLFVRGRQLGKIYADPGQIEQVILNLAVNARDAMPDGGALTIETANVQLDGDPTSSSPQGVPHSYVMLSVGDTGVGISATTRERIFEPFFTTKEIGKGTGLGLSTVLGIVQQSGGRILVESEPGKGTTFKVYLPHADGALVKSESLEPLALAARGSETVLVAEDDAQVRQLVRAILTRNGYRVLDACNAGEALLICEQHAGVIDLLVTDLIMPKLSGWQLAERLVRLHPHMKVLFMSGHINDVTVHRCLQNADVALLQKPITPKNLSRKVREVLDGP